MKKGTFARLVDDGGAAAALEALPERSGTPKALEMEDMIQLREKATTHHSFRGSFSDVSTPILASK